MMMARLLELQEGREQDRLLSSSFDSAKVWMKKEMVKKSWKHEYVGWMLILQKEKDGVIIGTE